MTKKITERDIYDAIKSAFESLMVLSKAELKKRWKNETTDRKYAAGRALVQLGKMAKEPEQHFSRAATGAVWEQRVKDWGQKNNIPKDRLFDGYYIVPSPTTIALDKVEWIFGITCNHDLYREFWNLAEAVQNWEYNRTSQNPNQRYVASRDAERIIERSKRLKALAGVKSANCVARQFKQLAFNINYQR